MDLSKNFKVATLIVLPVILVAGFYGYKYIQNKKALKKIMQEKYREINSVDDFLEGVKYLDKTTQNGYDFTKLFQNKDELEKMSFRKLKRLYDLAKKGQVGRTPEEDEEFLALMNIVVKK